MAKPLIIAHRGASKLAHENTLEAFGKAIELGADMIELDVRKTRDGVLAVIHDPKIGNAQVGRHDYGELENLAREAGFHLPTLEEVLVLVQGKIRLDMELKETGYEAEAVRTVGRYLPPQDFLVTSFHRSSMGEIKSANRYVSTGLLLDRGFIKAAGDALLVHAGLLRFCDFVLPHADRLQSVLNNDKFIGKEIYVWTADEESLIEKLLKEPRVAGVITNVPDVALRLRDRAAV